MKRFLYILFLFLLCSPLMADKVKDLQRERQQIEEELRQTNAMLAQTKKNERATINKLNLLNNNIKNRKKLIRSLNREIQALDNDLGELGTKQAQLNEQLQRLRQDYARLVRETHYADMKRSPLLFLFAADDFQQLVRRVQYMRRFAQYRRQQAAEIEELQKEADIQSRLLNERRSERATALQAQQREQQNLARDERRQQAMLRELKKKEQQLIAQQKKQQKKANELQKKIDQLIKQQTTATLTREQKLLAGGFEANKGRLPWPVEKGFISGQFGTHQHPVYEHVTVNNKGIYIQTTAGSSARAVFEGEVTSCIVLGNTYAVIVQHGNYRTVYSNLQQLAVKQGDKVKSKQTLGTIASDPANDNKTELYFQVYKDRTLLNPTAWITK